MRSNGERLVSIAEFCDETLDSFSKSRRLLEAVSQLAPWAVEIGEAASDAIPLVRFAVRVLSTLSGATPARVATIAATVAYQRALVQAMRRSLVELPHHEAEYTKSAVAGLHMAEDYPFTSLASDSPTLITFLADAEAIVSHFLVELGAPESGRLQVIADTRMHFQTQLRFVAFGDTGSSGQILRQMLGIPADSLTAARTLLREYAHLEVRNFVESPVLREPFGLASVYMESDCDKRIWKDARHPSLPVSREPLLDTVVSLLIGAATTEPVVVQGIAGSGKSSFTARLAEELLRKGLIPVRIRLRDVALDVDIKEALGAAVKSRLGHEGLVYEPLCQSCPEVSVFQERILEERVTIGGTRICPYVLILDGWDELTTSASTDYRRRVSDFLGKVRLHLLERFHGAVRVVLTGRPSHDIDAASFMRATTPFLSILPFSSDQLDSYLRRLAWTLEDSGARWRVRDADRTAVVEAYRRSDEDEDDIMGHPLLAFVAMRVQAAAGAEDNLIIRNRTLLLQRLVDLTVSEAGKLEGHDPDPNAAKVRGDLLRALLRVTAATMTIDGVESTGRRALGRRLAAWVGPTSNTLREHGLAELTEPLHSSLMISFYFRKGTDSAMEFAHKSFREYLFAEELALQLTHFATSIVDSTALLDRDVALSLCKLLGSPDPGDGTVMFVEMVRTRIRRKEWNLTTCKAVRDLFARLWHWLDSEEMWMRRIRHDESGRATSGRPPSFVLSEWFSADDNETNSRAMHASAIEWTIRRFVGKLCVLLHHEVAMIEAPGWGRQTAGRMRELPPASWRVLSRHVDRPQATVSTPAGQVTMFAPRHTGHLGGLSLQSVYLDESGGGSLDGGSSMSWCLMEGAHVSVAGSTTISQSMLDNCVISVGSGDLTLRRCSAATCTLRLDRHLRVAGCDFRGATVYAQPYSLIRTYLSPADLTHVIPLVHPRLSPGWPYSAAHAWSSVGLALGHWQLASRRVFELIGEAIPVSSEYPAGAVGGDDLDLALSRSGGT